MGVKFLLENLKSLPTISLCNIMVHFGANLEMRKICMQELALREENGETFDFRSYIDSKENPIKLNQATFEQESSFSTLLTKALSLWDTPLNKL
jgi:hypothetical protein